MRRTGASGIPKRECGNTGAWRCREKIAKLGPDPLREDADAERLWETVQASKKPIGLVLMDQSMVAGLGNIYRAEVLFKVCPPPHPPRPATGPLVALVIP